MEKRQSTKAKMDSWEKWTKLTILLLYWPRNRESPVTKTCNEGGNSTIDLPEIKIIISGHMKHGMPKDFIV